VLASDRDPRGQACKGLQLFTSPARQQRCLETVLNCSSESRYLKKSTMLRSSVVQGR
jgi:hypothetical protein